MDIEEMQYIIDGGITDTEDDENADPYDGSDDDFGGDSGDDDFEETTKKRGKSKASTQEKAKPVKKAKKESSLNSNEEKKPKSGLKKTTQEKNPKPVAAPKKKKGSATNSTIPTVSDKEGYHLILNYMNEQNRPYSHNNVYDNLHKQVKKTSVSKILDNLADEGKLQRKEFGKTKIFLADQKQYPECPQSEVDEQNARIAELKAQLLEKEQECGILSSKISELSQHPTNTDAETEVAKLDKTVEERSKELEQLKSTTTLISDDQVAIVENDLAKFKKLWKQRKSACKGMADVLADGMDKKPIEVLQSFECELDEDVGVDVNAL